VDENSHSKPAGKLGHNLPYAAETDYAEGLAHQPGRNYVPCSCGAATACFDGATPCTMFRRPDHLPMVIGHCTQRFFQDR